MIRSLHDRGDTIVEVLITIAIIGITLAGAYATSNRSLRDVTDSQEHETAIQLAQSQLELLSTQSVTDLESDGNGPFCFNVIQAVSNDSNYASNCVGYDSNDDPENFTVAITNLDAQSISADKPLATYEVQVTWDRLAGGTDSVQMYYQPSGLSSGL